MLDWFSLFPAAVRACKMLAFDCSEFSSLTADSYNLPPVSCLPGASDMVVLLLLVVVIDAE